MHPCLSLVFIVKTIVYEDKNIEAYHIQDNHLVLMDEHKKPNNDYTLSRK